MGGGGVSASGNPPRDGAASSISREKDAVRLEEDRQSATAFFWNQSQACTVSYRQDGQAGFKVDTAVAVKAPVEIPQILGPKPTESTNLERLHRVASDPLRCASARMHGRGVALPPITTSFCPSPSPYPPSTSRSLPPSAPYTRIRASSLIASLVKYCEHAPKATLAAL
ncbi:uncharacterized conserved protein [Moesziomyces antarcticus T-34]|uniref:Uncharacterized conserved protein n=1 Tax=Pseudozyma antarctica (strain T-34) TaxID=1151754 RepID=M9M562_PSEA3|nr:uncharacterized conserved protein [Moesziomyces antarcticus T-34]